MRKYLNTMKYGMWSRLMSLCGVMYLVGCIGTAPPLSGVDGEGGQGGQGGVQKQGQPALPLPKALPFCQPTAPQIAPFQLELVKGEEGSTCQLKSLSSFGNGKMTSRVVYEDRGETVEVRRYVGTEQVKSRDLWRRDAQGRLVDLRNFTVNATGEELRSHRHQELDAAGHVLSDSYSYWSRGKETKIVQTQVWESGRLVKREQIAANGYRHEWRWSYDSAGRVLTASQLSLSPEKVEQSFSIVWTYDSEGRPTSLVSLFDGQEQGRQSWEWSATGILKKRTITSILNPKIHAGLLTNPKQESSCRKLPIHWGHGYDESAYTPGWTTGKPVSELLPAMKEFPHQTDYLGNYGYYGYYGYGYYSYYGYYGYYGYHGGYVSEGQLAPPYTHFGSRMPHGMMSHRGFASLLVIAYDDKGRMIEESVKQATAADQTEPDQRVWSRKRTWDGELLREDELTLYREGEKSYTRLLRFAYDNAGRLQRRTLLQGELRVEEQEWRYNAGGQLIGHHNTILTQESMSKLQQWEQSTEKAPLPTDLTTDKVIFSLQWDGTTRLRSESLTWERQKSTHQRNYTYSEQGHTSTIIYGQAGALQKRVSVHNHRGQLLRLDYDNDNDGKPESSQIYHYNAQGLMTEETSISRGPNRTATNSNIYEYTCQ